MNEIIKVTIPTDGTIPPCPICGSITVNMDGEPSECPLHRCCPPCGGTMHKWDTTPNYCDIHSCHAWFSDPRDPRGQSGWSCRLRNCHDGEHTTHGLTFSEWSILGQQIEVHICVDYKLNNQGGMSPVYEWKKQTVNDVTPAWSGEGGPRVNDYEFSRWRRA